MSSKKVQTPCVCHGHSRPIVEVNYSPVTPDGYFLVSASKDGQPMLREGKSGDWIGTFQGHKGAVWSCVLNDSALLAATGSADFTARVWDALSGDEQLLLQHPHIVRTVQFAHTSNKLLTGGHDKLLRVFDLERPDAAPTEISGSPGTIRNATWLRNDTLLLTSHSDQPGVQVWDVASQRIVQTLPTASAVMSIEVTSCGRYVTTTDGKTVTFWEVDSLAPSAAHTLKFPVNAASFCPARQRFVAGGEDMWVRLYDAGSGAELETNKGHHGPVHTIKFAPTGELYASGSEDGTIRIWPTDAASDDAQANGA